jgi:pimeloyl-ACP methyl ester carboxylesterase
MYIWGRSMGAVTALLYQSKYKGVNGLILDSPFHSLYEIFVSQIVNLTGLPRFIAESVVFIANSSYRNLLKYDIKDMDIL